MLMNTFCVWGKIKKEEAEAFQCTCPQFLQSENSKSKSWNSGYNVLAILAVANFADINSDEQSDRVCASMLQCKCKCSLYYWVLSRFIFIMSMGSRHHSVQYQKRLFFSASSVSSPGWTHLPEIYKGTKQHNHTAQIRWCKTSQDLHN